jgi:hypothetical protein
MTPPAESPRLGHGNPAVGGCVGLQSQHGSRLGADAVLPPRGGTRAGRTPRVHWENLCRPPHATRRLAATTP